MVNPSLPESVEYEKLGRALRVLRGRSGLTQVEAAERIGIRDTFVSQIENGRRGTRYHTLLAFLAAYDSSLAELAELVEADGG